MRRTDAPPHYKADLESGPMRHPGVVPFVWEQLPASSRVSAPAARLRQRCRGIILPRRGGRRWAGAPTTMPWGRANSSSFMASPPTAPELAQQSARRWRRRWRWWRRRRKRSSRTRSWWLRCYGRRARRRGTPMRSTCSLAQNPSS
uniref:Uncharacterized protein n=1 Tax=Arundo donax TaxID=35708 RepID=A0A0A9CWG5_ARUDO